MLNAQKTRTIINGKLHLILAIEFERILPNENFDKGLLIENLHNCRTRAGIFLTKTNKIIEFPNLNGKIADNEDVVIEIKAVDKEEDENKGKKLVFLIVVLLIFAALMGFLTYKIFFSKKVLIEAKEKQINSLEVKNEANNSQGPSEVQTKVLSVNTVSGEKTVRNLTEEIKVKGIYDLVERGIREKDFQDMIQLNDQRNRMTLNQKLKVF